MLVERSVNCHILYYQTVLTTVQQTLISFSHINLLQIKVEYIIIQSIVIFKLCKSIPSTKSAFVITSSIR